MPYLETAIGAGAALCTTVSYVPQLRKSWASGETGDLSLNMLLLLACGLSLWIAYGVTRDDWVIIAANGVSLTLLACILYFKLRNHDR
jgi:MtN3 and saliva related transmembrane protein